MQDLKTVLAEVGLDWELDGAGGHYSEICPRCRRRLIGFSQAQVIARSRGTVLTEKDIEQSEQGTEADSASLADFSRALVN